MSGKWTWKLAMVAVVAVVAALPLAAQAQDAGEKEELPRCPVCDFKRDHLEPVNWLKWGADFRVRGIWDKNVMSLDDGAAGNERFWQRYRGRAWATITPVEDVNVNLGVTWEFKNFCRPTGKESHEIRETNFDEVVVERLNVEWANAFGLPMTVKAGRQNLADINSWLFLEGTPLDGSISAYFDAVRTTYNLEAYKTTIDAVFICNRSDKDQRIPPINDRRRDVIEHDELAAVLYAKNKSLLPGHQVDAFYIWKKTNQVFASGWDSDLSTFGGRIGGDLDENWSYFLNVAGQIGNKEGKNVCAMGAYGRLSYFLRDEWNNNFRLSYEYRSGGDHPHEDFDILWGRCPQCFNIAEGYLDRLEGRPAMFNNMHRVNLGWSSNPMPRMGLHFDYHILFADQNQTDNLATTGLSKSGCLRGHMLQALLTYQFTESLSGHLIGEAFFPGNFYTHPRTDPAYFVRYQLVFKF